MKKKNIEDLFKDSFENFEAEVSPSVWKNVQAALKGAGLGLLGKMLINKMGANAIVGIVSSAAAVVATVFVMNGTENKTNTPKALVAPKVVVETKKPSVAEIKEFLSVEKEETKEDPAVVKAVEPVLPAKKKIVNKDKKQIQSLLSDERIASISASCVAGAVPLIINLSNIGSGKINKWSFNDGSKPMLGVNPIKYFDEPGIYTITLSSTGVDGKIAVDSIKVEAFNNSSIAVSNQREFSPNGDGLNDLFVFNGENILVMEVTIFDKDAKVIYEFKGNGFKWDGKNKKGENVREGNYLYIISADGADGKKYEQKGKIKLTR